MPLRLQATEDDVYHLMDLKEQYFIMTAICSVAEGISAYFFIYQKRCWDLVYLCTALALAIILLLRQAIKISRSVMAPMAFSRTERMKHFMEALSMGKGLKFSLRAFKKPLLTEEEYQLLSYLQREGKKQGTPFSRFPPGTDTTGIYNPPACVIHDLPR